MTQAAAGIRLGIAASAMFLAASGAGITTAVITNLRPAQDLVLSVPLLGLAIVLLASFRALQRIDPVVPSTRARRAYAGFVLVVMACLGMASVLAPVMNTRLTARNVDVDRDVRAHERVLKAIYAADCAGAIGIVDTWRPLTTSGAIAKKGVLLQLYSGFAVPSSGGRDAESLHRRCLGATSVFGRVDALIEIGEAEARTWNHVPIIGGAMERFALLIRINQREWCIANDGARCDLLPELPAIPPVETTIAPTLRI